MKKNKVDVSNTFAFNCTAETMTKQNKYPKLGRKEISVNKIWGEGARSTSVTLTIPVKKVLIISRIFLVKSFLDKKTSMIVSSPSIEPCCSFLQFLLFCTFFSLFCFFFALHFCFLLQFERKLVVGIPSLSVRYTRGDPCRSQ